MLVPGNSQNSILVTANVQGEKPAMGEGLFAPENSVDEVDGEVRL